MWLACGLCVLLLLPVLAELTADAVPPCSRYAGIRGQVQCGNAGQTLTAQNGSCSMVAWTLQPGGYFAAKQVFSSSTTAYYNFYLDGAFIGSASMTTCTSGSCYRNVTLNACPTTPTTPVSCVSYNITGSVADCDVAVLHPAVAGAKVFVLGHPEFGTATTDGSGCFDLGAAPAGTYTLMAVSGGKSAYGDITLPDTIPPCGDCQQAFMCIESGGPCPNAADADQCCAKLQTADQTLYQLRCASAAATTTTQTTSQTSEQTTTASTGATSLLIAVAALGAAAVWTVTRERR